MQTQPRTSAGKFTFASATHCGKRRAKCLVTVAPLATQTATYMQGCRMNFCALKFNVKGAKERKNEAVHGAPSNEATYEHEHEDHE